MALQTRPKAYNYRYHQAWVDFLQTQNFTHVLSLDWGRDRCVGYERIFRDVKSLHAKVDRVLLGSRYHKKSNRTEAIFFVEGDERVRLHVHSYWRVPLILQPRFEELFLPPHLSLPIWKDVVPAGTCDLQRDDKPYASAKYLTKEFHYDVDERRLILSKDFLPANAPTKGVS